MRKVGQFAEISDRRVDTFIKKEERLYYHYLEDFSDFYSEYWWGLPSSYSVIADSATNIAINKFLVNQLGLIPALQIVTENPPEKFRDTINNEFLHLADDVCTKAEFEEDSYIIHEKLKNMDFGRKPPIIFGSTWERDVAKELNSHVVEITFPASYEVVINRSYIGYRGALTLLEKIFTEAVGTSA